MAADAWPFIFLCCSDVSELTESESRKRDYKERQVDKKKVVKRRVILM